MAADGPDAPFRLSARDVFAAIESLRNENREARHSQANRIQQTLGEVEDRLDSRLRALEVTIAAAVPQTLGPRINDLEREMARLDGDHPGGAPKRINDLEAWRDQMTGSLRTLQIMVTLLGGISAVLGVIAWFKP